VAPKDDEPSITLDVPGAPGRTVTGAGTQVRRYVAEIERQLVAKTQWPADNHEQMTALAELFPCFRPASGDRLPGIGPWDPAMLVEALNGGGYANSVRHAAMFLLSVWNRDDWTVHGLKVRKPGKDAWKGDRRIGRFDFNDAWACWDQAHRAAALAWLLNPFWP
jgi:hypothetical protein